MSSSPAAFRQAPPRIVSRTPTLETKLTAQFHVKDVAHFPQGASFALERRRGLQNPSQPQSCPVLEPLEAGMPDVLMLSVITKGGRGPATLARVAETMGAPQSRRVEMIQDGRFRRIPDPESRIGQLPSEQGIAAETQPSGPQFRVERGHALQNGAAETHAGADQLTRPLVKLGVVTRRNPPPVHRTQPGPQEMRR